MKQPLPLLIGILVVYILGSAFWYTRTACCTGATAAATSAAGAVGSAANLANTTGLGAIDATNGLNLNANENLYFAPSTFNFLPLSDKLSTFHQDLADYLIEHPNRTVAIKGRYLLIEDNTSSFSSIGLARANQIKDLLLEHNVPEGQLLITDDLVKAISKTDELFDNSIIFDFEDTVSDFENTTSTYEENTSDYEEATTDYDGATSDLEENTPDYEEAATDYDGATSDLEETTPDYEEAATDYDGATSDLEETTPDYEEATTDYDDTADVEDTTPNYEELTPLEERLRNNTITLYFDSNAKQLALDNDQRQYLTDLVDYLNNNPEEIVLATGHADNEGDWNINRYFSRKRAQFVRNYLIGNGINIDQIKVIAAGAEKPVASNDTEEGRAKNRRVEITLK